MWRHDTDKIGQGSLKTKQYGIGNTPNWVGRTYNDKVQRYDNNFRRLPVNANDLHEQPKSRRLINYASGVEGTESNRNYRRPVDSKVNSYHRFGWGNDDTSPKHDELQEHYSKLGNYYKNKYGA